MCVWGGGGEVKFDPYKNKKGLGGGGGSSHPEGGWGAKRFGVVLT